MTKLDIFDYDLPEELIAQHPAGERDASRLLIVDRKTGKTEHRHFFDLPEYLKAGDILVLNDSRVIKARLLGDKEGTGARVELLLTRQLDGKLWEALARPAKRLHSGDRVSFGEGFEAEVKTREEDGLVSILFKCECDFWRALERFGHTPLPPYIRREDVEEDTDRYQCVYAEKPGSAAAPTAGLHFTEDILEKLRDTGVDIVFVTLHVGPGTFRPVQTDNIEDHKLHEEYYHIDEDAQRKIDLAKAEGRRVICVGTTSVRTIESAYAGDGAYGRTDIFFYPGGREFLITDALITNFHLPKSTLLMLVCAFYDREKILEIYGEAIKERYRFYSYGDAMLIL